MLVEVHPGLWQGSVAEHESDIRRTGARWALDLHSLSPPPCLPVGVYWCSRMIPDGPGVTLAWLRETVAMVLEAMRHGPALVLCGAGASRSSLVTAACIMAMEELPSARAIATLKERKPDANPNPDFVRLLAEYGRSLGVE